MLIDLLESSKAIGLCPMGKMMNCRKFNFLLFLTINSVTTGVRELNGTSQISLYP